MLLVDCPDNQLYVLAVLAVRVILGLDVDKVVEPLAVMVGVAGAVSRDVTLLADCAKQFGPP